MTWLYVPGLPETSSPSAQASEGSNSVSPSLSTPAERLLAASVTWRGKLQQPQAWSRRWKQGGFIRLLSGLTCSPSTLDAGVDTFISSLPETRARKTVLPESARARPDHASSLPRSAVSPMSAGLILSSARTYRGMQASSSRPSSQHWNGWATGLRQEYSARPKPVIPCAVSDCSSWPGPDATNRVRDEETLAKCAAFRLRNAGQKTVPLYLAEVAEQWRSPTDDMRRGGAQPMSKRLAEDHTANLQDQVMEWMAPVADDVSTRTKRYAQGGMALSMQSSNWAALAAQNHKGSSEGCITRSDGKSREDILSYQAEQFFRPPSSPDQPIAGGSMSSTDSPNSNQPSVKRKLNPIFVEALMRWPTGLSGFERQETAWIRWWLLMPSFVSALCSPRSDPEQGNLW